MKKKITRKISPNKKLVLIKKINRLRLLSYNIDKIKTQLRKEIIN